MKLAISNIAWREADDAVIAPYLIGAGAQALEIAPGRVGYREGGAAIAESVRALWQGRGLPIGSMQSLLFGVKDAALFGTAYQRRTMIEALTNVIAFAGALGCGPLVFGSPGNRVRGDLPLAEAIERAVPFFRQLGDAAAAAGCTLCIEANAPAYGCDFVTNLQQASQVVDAVAHPGIGMMVDTGNMELAGDTLATLRQFLPRIRHLHLSAPQLAPVTPDTMFARRVLEVMLADGFDGTAMIEMRAVEGDCISAAVRAVETVRGWIDG